MWGRWGTHHSAHMPMPCHASLTHRVVVIPFHLVMFWIIELNSSSCKSFTPTLLLFICFLLYNAGYILFFRLFAIYSPFPYFFFFFFFIIIIIFLSIATIKPNNLGAVEDE
jgi:hypothetical protein